MCASKVRCLIRLAQPNLGTGTDRTRHFEVSSDDIKMAEGYLGQVDVNGISHRCMALYYLIESDLHQSIGSITDAIESSRKAKAIAKEKHLAVELQFAEARLTSLHKHTMT